jgi:hypothetical protein
LSFENKQTYGEEEGGASSLPFENQPMYSEEGEALLAVRKSTKR